MQAFTVALLQMRSGGAELASNLLKGEEFCREAARDGADIALFPEMWSNGYDIFAGPGWTDAAIPVEDDFVAHFRSLARELDIAMVLTLLERRADGVRNFALVIDRDGEVKLDYAKIHTCAWGPEGDCLSGDGVSVTTLMTRAGPVNVGVMICYDREFPETARMLMLKGADVILTPNACLLEPVRLAQFQVRAFENVVGVAMTNYAYSDEQWNAARSPAARFNGHSVAFGPICFDEAGEPRDPKLVEADEQEGVFLATFDVDEIAKYRDGSVWGARYRRPNTYAAITSS